MQTIQYKGFTIRPGTMDDYIVNEIASYKTLAVGPEDTVLDIGANIGTFSSTALSHGATVISVEPDPENFGLLCINAPEATKLNLAVTGQPLDFITLYKNVGKNKGLHSTVPTRGREEIQVPAMTFKALLEMYAPTKIKIDCEGAEYYFLYPQNLPERVKGLIIEYNLTRKTERPAAFHLHKIFMESGWECVKWPKFDTKAWATLASYRR